MVVQSPSLRLEKRSIGIGDSLRIVASTSMPNPVVLTRLASLARTGKSQQAAISQLSPSRTASLSNHSLLPPFFVVLYDPLAVTYIPRSIAVDGFFPLKEMLLNKVIISDSRSTRSTHILHTDRVIHRLLIKYSFKHMRTGRD